MLNSHTHTGGITTCVLFLYRYLHDTVHDIDKNNDKNTYIEIFILGVEINVPVADVDFKYVDEPLKLGIGSPYFGKGYSKCKKKF